MSEQPPDLPPSETRWTQLRVVAEELGLPAALVLIFGSFLVAQPYAMQWIDRFPPQALEVPLATHAQRQRLHAQVETLPAAPRSRIALVGSSAVVNGIDIGQLERRWQSLGLPAHPVKIGMTGLLGYELPMLKRELIQTNHSAIVYFYNYYAFGNRIHSLTNETRWDTREYFLLRQRVEPGGEFSLSSAFTAEWSPLYRYRHLIGNRLLRAAMGTTRTLPDDYDYLLKNVSDRFPVDVSRIRSPPSNEGEKRTGTPPAIGQPGCCLRSWPTDPPHPAERPA